MAQRGRMGVNATRSGDSPTDKDSPRKSPRKAPHAGRCAQSAAAQYHRSIPVEENPGELLSR
jgi:hypothetical protein